MDVPVNYLAIFVAALVAMGLGFVWYGPLFGKQWLALSGRSEADIKAAAEKGMGKTYAIMAVSTLVMYYVLAHSLVFASSYLNATGAGAGLAAGFWNWLGYIAPVTLGSVLWDGRSWTYWFITTGYYLAALLLGGVILAVWV